MKGSICLLMANQNVLNVEPHAPREKQSQSQTRCGISSQLSDEDEIVSCYNLCRSSSHCGCLAPTQ